MRMKFGLLAAMLMAAAVTCVTALAGSQASPGVTKTKFVIGGTFPLSGPACVLRADPRRHEGLLHLRQHAAVRITSAASAA